MTLVFTAVLPWLLIALGTWLGYQLVRQNGRILLRLEAIEQRLSSPSAAAKPAKQAGLPIGSAAPDFDLLDLTGKQYKLSDFREQNVLLLFFNPRCGYCTKMAADLAALPADGGPDRVVTVVITTGDADENRNLIEKHRIRSIVLLQEEMKVANLYRAQGTPMGYRIDPEGRIASELAVGAEQLLKLADLEAPPPPVGRGSPDPAHRRVSARSETSAEQRNGSAHQGKQPDPSLARSRLNRSGLKAGTVAPDFSLPLLAGGELSLAELRGRRVLLVFSDPNCGPCDQLAPLLQELHEEQPDLHVLVISRRDAEATAAKAEALGLTFPIVMQRQWEISKEYGMFATPVGYLIDERGIVAKDVAMGVKPILALADEPATEVELPLNGKEAAWATLSP